MNKSEKSVLYNEWAKYKYVVMERNYKYYKQCSKLIKDGCTLEQFNEFINNIKKLQVDRGNFINTAEHVWGYVKKKATKEEIQNFKEIIENYIDYKAVKQYLLELCKKYNAEYVLNSYYFNY